MGLRSAFGAFIRELTTEQKLSRAGPVIVGFDAGQTKMTPRRYDKLADEGYGKNSVVYRCVNLIAEEAAAVPWLLFKGKGKNKTLVEEHPILDLLARPNATMSGNSFFVWTYSYRLLSGNSYIEGVGPDTGPRGGQFFELYSHRPDRMRIKASKKGSVQAYVLESNGAKVVWMVNQETQQADLLHSKAFHPLNDWFGMSPLEAAAFEVDQHNAAGIWNFSLLKNQARPSGAFVFVPNKDGIVTSLDDEEFTRLQNQIDERMAGQYNAGRPLVLEGGLDWRQIAMSPTDMDWLHGRDMSARDIAMAYDVPPQLVGVEGSQTYANFEQAVLSLYDNAVIPLIRNYRDDLNLWLTPRYDDNLYLEYDKDSIEALQPRRQAKWDNVSKSDFLTINEKREALGFDKIEDPNADTLLIALGKVPLGMAGQPMPLPEPTGGNQPNKPAKKPNGSKPPARGKENLLAPPPPEDGYDLDTLRLLEDMTYGRQPRATNGAG